MQEVHLEELKLINGLTQYEGFNITFQVTDDCNLKCTYCLPKNAKILMSDFSLKNIQDIVIDDNILGFDEFNIIPGAHRKVFPSKVIELYKKQDATIILVLDNGSELEITKEHPILTTRGSSIYSWKQAGKLKVGEDIGIFPNHIENKNIDYNKTLLTKAKIINILPGKNQDVYNIGTDSRTYIANYVAVHNCYEVNKKPGVLNLEYAKKFIDIILEDNNPINTDRSDIINKGLILDFIGGDALMVPDLCDQILQYFQFRAYELNHKWKDRWRASISTNGTLFGDPKVQKFLEKYKGNLSIGISIDGCPEIHDKNRVFRDGSGSMSTIMKHWDYYMNYMGEGASTKATLNKESIPYIYESIKFLHEELKLSQINMNFIFEDMHLEEEDYIEIEEQFKKVIDYIYEHKDDIHVNMFDKGFGIGSCMTDESKDKGWCGAGSMPCLSLNGKIYPCFRFTPNTMHKDNIDFSVGDVTNGLNRKDRFEIVRQQTREKISPDSCKFCDVESSCAWCIGGTYSEFGEFSRNTNLCRIKKLIDKYSRIYWKRYNENSNCTQA